MRCLRALSRAGDPAGDVIFLNRGDGGALVYLGDRGKEDARKSMQQLVAEAYAQQLQLRIGVEFGQCRVAVDGDGRRELIGGTINRAFRLLSVAEPGQVLVSDTFYRASFRDEEEPGRTRETQSVKHGEEIAFVRLLTRGGRVE